ncbi:hypothetical protein [Paraglaciecola sp.]|uniref:hypothetical protein n=1 Tax=Paraglaciecola sp. TaxID=1920173 RepID=UPI0030F47179
MTWVDVADTAIKIGLGAVIAAVSGYIALKRTQSFEMDKRKEEAFNKQLEERKIAYIEFSTLSSTLIKKYDHASCEPSGDDYIAYLTLHSKIQILACDGIRKCMGEAFNSVTVFILSNTTEYELKDKLRDTAKNSIGVFQMYAQQDITRVYNP